MTRRGYAASRSPPLRAPTNCASPEIWRRTSSKPRSSSAPVISSRPNTRSPVAAPTSVPDRRRGERRAGRGEDRHAPAGGEHARHRVQRRERLVEQVQRGEAADRVEAAVAERQADRVAADVGDVRRLLGVLHRAREHRLRRVEPDHEPALPDRARELAHEVAGTAGDVEHGVARPELQQVMGDPPLALPCPGPSGPISTRPHAGATSARRRPAARA